MQPQPSPYQQPPPGQQPPYNQPQPYPQQQQPQQYQTGKIEKGQVIAELQGRNVSTAVREVNSGSVKLEMNNVAQVTGPYSARHIETTIVEQKADGTNEWESKAIENTPQGDVVVIQGKGKGQASGSGNANWTGELEYMTKSPGLKWLDGTKARVEGTANMQTGEYTGRIYKK